MKRKTNLFYVDGPDSKFITFSNYTEALTGNYISVNSKLFPDNFLCLNIKNLNSNTKELFIKYLVKYYENKLAVLRDYNVHHNETIEENMYTLSYLLEAILKVVVLDDGEYKLNTNENNTELIINNDVPANLEVSDLITYIGQISESDYYGTYTDIICNINCENYNEGIIKYSESTSSSDERTVTINDYPNTLYGWENDDYIFNGYDTEDPIYDNEIISYALNKRTDGIYSFNTKLSRLIYDKIDTNSSNYDKTLKFNVIIPLFSLVNINSDYELYSERNRIEGDSETRRYIILGDRNKHCFDSPLGIWIYADKEYDTFIQLIKDTDTNLYPNWSLMIASQFKPFPYSTYKKENATANNPESESITNAFSTFAEVISKMNDVLDAFNKMNLNLANMTSRISKVEKEIKEIGTVKNIQKIDEKVVQLESSINTKMEEFKKHIYGYLNNIKWSSMG